MSRKHANVMLIASAILLVQTAVQAQSASNKPAKKQEQTDLFNANNNPKGSDCYRRIAYIRKLENNPRFDSDTSMRQEWQRKIEEAGRLKCNL